MRPQRLVLSLVLIGFATIAATASGLAQTEPTSAPVTVPSLSPMIPPTAASMGPSSNTSSSVAFPTDPALHAAMLVTFQNLMVEQRRLGDETRSAMLGSLTPAHRAFVASLVGQLATAPAPDPVAAARQIDASLSLNERLGVLRADSDRRVRERELMSRMLVDLTARMSPDERAAMQRQAALAQADALRLSPSQRTALLRAAESYMSIFAPGMAALGTPQSAGDLILQAIAPRPNVLGL